MLGRFFKGYEFRSFSNSSMRTDLEKVKPSAPLSEPVKPSANVTGGMDFTPSDFEKKILVWSGRFKSQKEIPHRISFDTLEKAKSRFRIRLANVMTVATLCLCGYYVWLGKKSLKEGDTINSRQLQKDRKILEDYRKNEQG